MSADIISMGGDLEGGSSAPDTGTDSTGGDYGLSSLENALDSTSSGQDGQAPPPASTGPSTGYQRVDFAERRGSYQKAQGGWKHREMQRQQQSRQYQEERNAWAHQMKEVADLMKQVAAANQQPGEQEAPPDPFTDWAGFQAWQAKQQNSLMDAKLKPIIERFEKDRVNEERVAQQQFQSEQQQQHISRTTSVLQEAHAAYNQQHPELAFGSEERITYGLDMLSSVFEKGMGWDPSDAHKVTLAIAQGAAGRGENPAMAVDAFFTNLLQEAAESVRAHYAVAGYDLPPIMPASPGGHQQDGGQQQLVYQQFPQQQQPGPAARENARLAAVRQRSQGVASPRPRQPARGNNAQPQSRAWSRANDYQQAGREVDWNDVQRIAQQEAGGNKAHALRIMQAIPR